MSKAADLARTASASETALGNRNLLINGANTIWQRGASLGSGVNRYVQDRWYQWGYGAIPTQQTGIDGIGYSARLQHNDATANSFSAWNQSLETSDTVYARGNKTTFSVYIKKGSAFTGNLNLQIVERTDAQGSVNTGTRNVLHSENIAGSLTTSFQRFTITSNNNVSASAKSIGVNIDHSGTSGTDSNNYFEFTQAQLEVGPVATPFEYRSYGQNLALCNRYYWNTYNGAAIGSNTGQVNVIGRSAGGQSYETISEGNFPTTMRAVPTMQIYNPITGTAGSIRGDSSNFATCQINFRGVNYYSFNMAGVAIGQSTFVSGNVTADAEL